jgi:hypothetical protein
MPIIGSSRRRLFDLGGRLIARAQEAGQLRPDLTREDLALVTWANARILQAGRAAGAPDAWRRHLGFLLDGFRAERASPSRSRRCPPGRSTGPCWSSAAARPAPLSRLDSGVS